jgi:hypothetical protein
VIGARSLAGLAAACVAMAAFLSPTLGAQEPNRAGIVVRHADGEVSEMCVLFDEDEITGEGLLERSNLDVTTETGAIGTAMCAIDGEGCGSDDCFCSYPTFWGYWTKDGSGDWTFSETGAADRVVRDGSIDGWSFGKDGKPEPPNRSIGDLCAGAVEASATPQRKTAAERPSYAGFVALVGLFAAGALLAYVVRRRRAHP